MLEMACLFIYCYLRRAKLAYILNTAERTFKYSSETGIDQVDMDVSIGQCRALVKWWSIAYFLGAHLITLWPLMSGTNERYNND